MNPALALLVLGAHVTGSYYAPAEYAVDLVTSDNNFCRSIGYGDGYAVSCSSTARGSWDTFNFRPFDYHRFKQQFKTGEALQLLYRPGVAMPAFLQPNSSGMVMTSFVREGEGPAKFAFEENPGIEGKDIIFRSTGTQLLYLKAGDSYCHVRDITLVDGTLFPAMLVCDLVRPNASTPRFRLRPVGWSWNIKRIMLRSILSNADCGNIFFQPEPQPVQCPFNATQPQGGFRADMYSHVISGGKLPMRDGAAFRVQAWIEFGLVSNYWDVDEATGALVAVAACTDSGLPGGQQPEFELYKAHASTEPIHNGTVVYLKSRTRARYCGLGSEVDGYPIICNSSFEQAKSERDRHTFLYIELLPGYSEGLAEY